MNPFFFGNLGGFFGVLYFPFYFYVCRKKLALGFTYPSSLITVAVRLLKILLNVFFFALYIYKTRFDLQIYVLNIVFNRQLFTSNFKACLRLNY